MSLRALARLTWYTHCLIFSLRRPSTMRLRGTTAPGRSAHAHAGQRGVRAPVVHALVRVKHFERAQRLVQLLRQRELLRRAPHHARVKRGGQIQWRKLERTAADGRSTLIGSLMADSVVDMAGGSGDVTRPGPFLTPKAMVISPRDTRVE